MAFSVGVPRAPMSMLKRAVNMSLHRPLIPFLKEPWTLDSKSRWPAILLEVFLYGIYVVLFSSCTFILWRQKNIQKTLFLISCVLFFLASTDVVVTVYFFFRFVIQNGTLTNSAHSKDTSEETWNPILEVKFAVYVVANLVNSSILIHRCHTLWQDWRITVAPVVLVTSGTLISFVSLKEAQLGDRLLAASFITSAAGNLSVTFLIATGMLWTSRKIRSVMKMDIPTLAGYTMSLLIDSGAFYSLSIFLYLVFHSVVISASLTQVGCIATTAISLLNSHSCESLGTEDSAFATNSFTRPDTRTPEPAYSPQQRLGSVPSQGTINEEQIINDDHLSVNSEYK